MTALTEDEQAQLAAGRELAAWFRSYKIRTGYGRPRPSRALAVRSEQVTCPGCVAAGASAEESFLIHADPAPPPPETDWGEADRLLAPGYSREIARVAATPASRREPRGY